MNKSDLYLGYLRKEGYTAAKDQDGDIVFKHKDTTYLMFAEENDRDYFSFALPRFWKIDEKERFKVLKAIDEVNVGIKVVKLLTVKDAVWAKVDILLSPIENFPKVFPRAFRLMGSAVAQFVEKMGKP